ncbi:MalY/PatB family protein [Desulfovibrio inopinatus]|uniref:MalY/PatB family protein n=1 Tax=Desulfovibrio inopinatus TaxID=102109 RepID=UPI000406E909|nr:MalY/PatB family protein [Desulfovibrio inopinatus]
MKYDFDTVIDRRGTHCEKWDGMEERFGVSPDTGLAMWVADMEFRPPPEVIQALAKAIDHGIFGYYGNDIDYPLAVAGWMNRRHKWRIDPEWILTSPGIVSGASLIIQALCKPGDAVVLMPPLYPPFYGAVTRNGCRVLECPLVIENGRYQMNLDYLIQCLQANPAARLLVLCSPHNPGGRVWTESELKSLAEICLDFNLLILSDEIHHDIVFPEHVHTPIATLGPAVAERTVTCTSATKTFNLAGTMTGNIIASNPILHREIFRQLARCGLYTPNMFGPLAAVAAYTHGAPWLDALLPYLKSNRDLVDSTVAEHLPGVTSMPLDGTYLSWLDFSGTGLPMEDVQRRITNQAGLALNVGATFGTGGETYMRFNFACPKSMLNQALDRLVAAFANG